MTKHMIELSELKSFESEEILAQSLRDDKKLLSRTEISGFGTISTHFVVIHKGEELLKTSNGVQAITKYNSIYQPRPNTITS